MENPHNPSERLPVIALKCTQNASYQCEKPPPPQELQLQDFPTCTDPTNPPAQYLHLFTPWKTCNLLFLEFTTLQHLRLAYTT